MGKLRIRKLTEAECFRFMGFERKDYEACVSVGQSAANIYHEAGDSIVTTVLAGIFGELLGKDYRKAIESHADKLHAEVSGTWRQKRPYEGKSGATRRPLARTTKCGGSTATSMG